MQKLQFLLLAILVASCTASAPAPAPTATLPPPPTLTATVTFTTSPEPVPTETATPEPTPFPPEVGKDYDYDVIPDTTTEVLLDGYPVRISVGRSMSSKMGDLEFNDPSVFASLMWEVEYQAWLGHKPEAEGMSLTQFKDLVAQAKVGDPTAMAMITYTTYLNDMDDQLGYKPQQVTVRPLMGGGWQVDGTLQPDAVEVVVVDPSKVKNFSFQGPMNEGFSFNYMRDPVTGEMREVIYTSGAVDGITWEKLRVSLAISLSVLPDMSKHNSGRLKYPAGNALSRWEEAMRLKLIGAMEISK